MKSFLSLFFTRPAKIIYVVVLLILSFFVAECQIGYFTLFSQDRESFINAISQIDSFDYETSYYFKNTVKNSIEDVITLSMKYSDIFENDLSDEELLSYYNSIGDHTFPEIYEELRSMPGFRFALVNHGEGRVYSNIREINGEYSSDTVRTYFSEQGKTLLIARSCKNPYFATDTFIDYAEHIRDCAEEYDDNFDLYIYFGSQESFDSNAKKYEQLHFNMRERIESLNNKVIIFVLLVVFVSVIILTVTGKQEPGGKTYGSAINRVPNDLFVFMHGIVFSCVISLYRTAAYMLINHGTELDEFWFTRQEDFYINRIKFCTIIMICLVVNFFCVLKRSYKTGNLVKNTYLYPVIQNIRKTLKKKNDNTEENKNEN